MNDNMTDKTKLKVLPNQSLAKISHNEVLPVLKTKVIAGFDVYMSENDYVFDSCDSDKKSLNSKNYPNYTTSKYKSNLFTRVIFAKPNRLPFDIELGRVRHLEHNIDNNNDNNANYDARIKQHEQNMAININLKKLQSIINREKSLAIPVSFQDNFKSPWELIEMKPEYVDLNLDKIKKYNDNENNILEEILNKIEMSDNINITNKIERFVLQQDSLLECYHSDINIDESFFLKKEHGVTHQIIIEYALFQKTHMFKSIIQILIANSIYEKVIRKINTDIKKIGGFSEGTFWMSIIHDNSSKYLQFANLIKKDKKNTSPYSKRKIISDTKNDNSSDRTTVHKDTMINHITEIIESLECNIPSINQYQSTQVTKLFKADEITSGNVQTHSFDHYGITKYLINHPFLLYCVVEDKLQLYKFFISSLTVDTIQYELYQIDEIIDAEPIRISLRPKIISRNLTDKFTISKQKDIRKFSIEYEKLNMNISTNEISKCDVSVLRKINNYSANWAALINVIITDATKCIRAFITNQKKEKINLDFDTIDQTICEKILNELQIGPTMGSSAKSLELNSDILISDAYDLNCYSAYEQMCEHLSKNLDKDYFTHHKYSSTKIYRDYHPISYTSQILRTRELKNEGHISKERLLPLFMDRYVNNENILSEFTGTGTILYEKISKRITIRDLVFISDTANTTNTKSNVYHHINGVHNNLVESTIVDLKIRSNCPLKLYLRVENKCLLVGEGNNIYIPIIPSYVMNGLHFKLASDPDELIEKLSCSNCPPYVNMTFVILKNPTEYPINRNGFMIDFINRYGDSDNTATVAYINHEINSLNSEKRVYFGIIQNIEHINSIENLIY
jgi:hypothetical protein